MTEVPEARKGARSHYCGACFLVLSNINLPLSLPWADGSCLPVAERPSDALALLRDTPWAGIWNLSSLRNTDELWWFED